MAKVVSESQKAGIGKTDMNKKLTSEEKTPGNPKSSNDNVGSYLSKRKGK